MATTVVLDDDDDVEEVVAITNWKDERMYNAVLGVCGLCYIHRKEKVKLPNRAKAIYSESRFIRIGGLRGSV